MRQSQVQGTLPSPKHTVYDSTTATQLREALAVWIALQRGRSIAKGKAIQSESESCGPYGGLSGRKPWVLLMFTAPRTLESLSLRNVALCCCLTVLCVLPVCNALHGQSPCCAFLPQDYLVSPQQANPPTGAHERYHPNEKQHLAVCGRGSNGVG